MELNFPINPTVGQTYQTGSSATYTFNGRFWSVTRLSPLDVISASFANTAISASNAIKAQSVVFISGSQPPTASLITGSLFFNNIDNELYLRSGSGYTATIGPDKNRTYISGSQPSPTRRGDLWFDTVREKMLVDINGSGSFVDAITGSAPLKNITKISTTGYGTTILVADGRVFGIKGNDGNYDSPAGALSPSSFATGLRRSIANAYEIPFPDETAGTVVDAGCYGRSAYALFANGDLYTWGMNNTGQLGINSLTNRFYPIQSNTGVTEVYPSIGENQPDEVRLLIKKTDNKIYGCGYNANGELGLGDTVNKQSWTELPWAGTNPLSVWNLGSWRGNIFVQRSDGQIWVSGWNGQGQIGNGGTTSSNSAQQVAAWLNGVSTNRIVQMFAGHREITSGDGQNHTNMMLLRNTANNQTTILGAGYNGHGQLGRNNTTNSNTPVSPLGTWTGVQEMAYVGGAVGTVYVLNTNGTVFAWGYNGTGLVGTGNTTSPQSSPVERTTPLSGATDIVQIPNGVWTFPYQTMAPPFRRADGYYTTGYNEYGQTGTGLTTTPLTVWTRMLFPNDVVIKFIGCLLTQNGQPTYLAVDTQNRIWGWGWNGQLQLDADISTNFFQPVQIVAEALMN